MRGDLSKVVKADNPKIAGSIPGHDGETFYISAG